MRFFARFILLCWCFLSGCNPQSGLLIKGMSPLETIAIEIATPIIDAPDLAVIDATTAIDDIEHIFENQHVSKSTCELQGGKWEQQGFDPYRCNLPAVDVGNSCQNSTECQGMCLLENTSKEAVENDIQLAISGGKIYGICSSYTIIRGCISHIENGTPFFSCRD